MNSRLFRFLEYSELPADIGGVKLATSCPIRPSNLAWVFNAVYPAISLDPPQHLAVRESTSKDTIFHYRKHPSEDSFLPQTSPSLTLSSDDILKSPRHDHLGELERHDFEMMKALEKLTVWTWGHCRWLLKDLHPEVVGDGTYSGDSTEEENSTTPPGVRLPLPALRKLTIIEATIRSPDPDTLPPIAMALSCFGARKQHGSHLEVLRFLACHHGGPNLDWVEELEESVREVFWEDVPYDEESESSGSDWASTSDKGEEVDNYFLYDPCFF